ncbi:MAG: hypothetical protein C4291_00930 [Candidatus Dadabacteria bacterium]
MNRRTYIYKQNLPLSFLPLVLFGLLVFVILAVLGLFVGLMLGAAVIGFIIVRPLFSSGRKKAGLEKDGRTITLKEGEYEIIKKKG